MKLNAILRQMFKTLLIVVIVFNIAGCTNKTKEDINKYSVTSSAEVNQDQENSYIKTDNKIDLSKIKIGYCTPSLNAPYYKALLTCIQEATENSGMTFLSADGQDNIDKQIAEVEKLIEQDIDVLLLNPLDPNGLIGVTQKAKAKGIPVFIIDSSIDESAEFITTIQSNNLKNGELVGSWLVKKMGSRKMNIALLSGAPGNPVGIMRKQGLFRGITEEQLRTLGYVDLNITTQAFTNWTYAGGQRAVQEILETHPEINVIITESDVCILGAIDIIEKAGKIDEILIVAAADGQKEALKYIMDSEFYGATAMNNPELIGKTAVEYAVQYLNGKRNFLKISHTPELLITKENASELYDPHAVF
ncbi:substrate-binding domain-containing protein [Aquimarina pacifica]|uniref:substrate-binding domain-containing protein n=1 Tax=Aquimarina pacifica TaxID=1296415 RepID=UPI000472617A|nr:substrate-binding domain-containing protein [Aquimarina pacifica]